MPFVCEVGLIYTRNVDFELYPWTLENIRHSLSLKRLYILYNIVIISFGVHFLTFELQSMTVHVFVLVLFLIRYTWQVRCNDKAFSTELKHCPWKTCAHAVSSIVCGFREESRFVKTTRIYLKQVTYLHCTVKISHFSSYPVSLKSTSDRLKIFGTKPLVEVV